MNSDLSLNNKLLFRVNLIKSKDQLLRIEVRTLVSVGVVAGICG